jgi:small-conductance mechanosensitive channel
MLKNVTTAVLFGSAALLLLLLSQNYTYPYLDRLFYTLLTLAILQLLLKTLLEESIAVKIKDPKARYSFRKTVSIIYFVLLSLILIKIWVEDTQTLIVSYGIIAAGVTISLQDFFKNFVGGILIFVTGIYRVGDRIEVNSKIGDVIDIGLLYTTLLELGEWIEAEQPTGRITTLPNGIVLSSVVNNYTKDNNFVWDEIFLPITYDSDLNEAVSLINEILRSETSNMSKSAEMEITKLSEKYYLTKKSVEPEIYIVLTDNWNKPQSKIYNRSQAEKSG